VSRALRLGRPETTVRVSGGRDLSIKFLTAAPVAADKE
jgi:hypothetical protein